MTELAIGVLMAVLLIALIVLVGNLASGWQKRESARADLEDRVRRLEAERPSEESASPDD